MDAVLESDAIHGIEPGLQYAALPYRLSGPGEVEILLITSRETRRWVIPKGWPMKGKKPHAAAAKEALQEAGVVGKIEKRAIGGYDYIKRLKNGAPLACTVEVFPMKVEHQRKRWRERGQRVIHWFSATEAAGLVDEEGLGALILSLAVILANRAMLKDGAPD
ncbi:MAG: NUDIX hydrolase [Proteobacteria bacterium]|nr:NUDIX hydrolase [Pseudomonadota bacterium]